MNKIKKYLTAFLCGVVGFFLPYVFVGGLHFMNSVDYLSTVKSELFSITVFFTTMAGLMLANHKE